MKKLLVLFLALCMAVPMIACGGNGGGGSGLGELEVKEGYVKYNLESPLEHAFDGYGSQLEPDMYMPWDGNLMTEDDYEIWEDRIADMDMDFTRVKYCPEFLERANDNDDPDVWDANAAGVDFDCVEMDAFFKTLDLCERNGVLVDLSFHGCYNGYKYYEGIQGSTYEYTWLGWTGYDFRDDWVTGPRMEYDGETLVFDGYAEYAENIAVLLDYLLNERGYTCIYGISVIAEMFVVGDGSISYTEYAKCVNKINERLIADGLRDDIVFIGHTMSAHNLSPRNFREEQLLVNDVFDIAGTGNYHWENSSPVEAMDNYFIDYLDACEDLGYEGFEISEFCQGKHFTDAVNKTDIDWYTAGLYIARLSMSAASNGVTSLVHYILGDTYFNNEYVHTMGLWMYKNSNSTSGGQYIEWAAHPEFYFYSLMSKYTDSGATVYPIKLANRSEEYKVADDNDVVFVNGVAFHNPDGSWTYMMANNSTDVDVKVAFANTDKTSRPNSMKCYRVTEDEIPQDRACTIPSAYTTIDTSNGVAHVTVEAQSFVVVSSMGVNA